MRISKVGNVGANLNVSFEKRPQGKRVQTQDVQFSKQRKAIILGAGLLSAAALTFGAINYVKKGVPNSQINKMKNQFPKLNEEVKAITRKAGDLFGDAEEEIDTVLYKMKNGNAFEIDPKNKIANILFENLKQDDVTADVFQEFDVQEGVVRCATLHKDGLLEISKSQKGKNNNVITDIITARDGKPVQCYKNLRKDKGGAMLADEALKVHHDGSYTYVENLCEMPDGIRAAKKELTVNADGSSMYLKNVKQTSQGAIEADMVLHSNYPKRHFSCVIEKQKTEPNSQGTFEKKMRFCENIPYSFERKVVSKSDKETRIQSFFMKDNKWCNSENSKKLV